MTATEAVISSVSHGMLIWRSTKMLEDLAKALKGELSSRRFGRAVRLEVTQNCPEHIYNYLLDEFDLHQSSCIKSKDLMNLAFIVQF